METIQTTLIPLSRLERNKGQIEGLPANPRQITEHKFKKLVASIRENPEMLNLRELVVYQILTVGGSGKYVVIGGNMRLEALKELAKDKTLTKEEREAYSMAPCKIIPEGTPVEKLQAFTLIDNSSFGDWDFDILANEWDFSMANDFCIEVPKMDFEPAATREKEKLEESESEKLERMKREFDEKMKMGELDEDDPEYQEFLKKFEAKKTTDDCYTPEIVYEAIAQYVADRYHENRTDFVRPFYPGGDYEHEKYKKGCVVVDNPPFSILSQIIRFYTGKNIKFFLFSPELTILGTAGDCQFTAIITNSTITYENNAAVATSFVTNLESEDIRAKSDPILQRIVTEANDRNLRQKKKILSKYAFPDNVITAATFARFSKYGVDFEVKRDECVTIKELEEMKDNDKAIYGGGLLISDRKAAEKAAAEKAAAEKAAAEKAAAIHWNLSDREKEIIQNLR